VLALDEVQYLLPVHAEGRVGCAVVELLVGEAVSRQGIATDDVLGVLPLDEHVRFADGIGLVVEFLAKEFDDGRGVDAAGHCLAYRQDAAGAGGGVVHRAHNARLGQGLVIPCKQAVHDELNHLTRGEVFPGGFVGRFRKLADELFEDQTHGLVGRHIGVQVHIGEFLHQLEQQVFVFKFSHALSKLEALEYVTGVLREVPHIGDEVLTHMLLVVEQTRQREGADVVESLGRLALEAVV